ncbi:AHH domain-containing protein [Amphritea pacifica]|uniref:AHH domain-containing protein n=1 Tax=Amphritea pacifica TaxID=2811233 RepID=A0ABS2WDH2_9GAMM|nr:AHH domain-containing protein [Amphritea pacifica]MBN0989631.1 AHH domain-containing protein [Amphritea pacifica]
MDVNLEKDERTSVLKTTVTNYFNGALTEAEQSDAKYRSFDTSLYGDNPSQIHHLIPYQSAIAFSGFFGDVFGAEDSYYKGYDINNAENLIVLPADSTGQTYASEKENVNTVVHRNFPTPHREYNDTVAKILAKVKTQYEADVEAFR